ncbi:LysR family transcriptional regulator [Sphingopyxis yananensis]|uniref:LysR family transcriptional regulator n=1 Tax=Sphingopyxis yananensis TaxID=2886687 RepID=UPI001D126AE4|nr:LysR family transcriptional regulator [Sphingopyxis yananensis]
MARNDRIANLRTAWLQALISVAETGTASDASRELDVSQPTISRDLKKLNEWAGRPITVKYATPTSKPFTLTDEGFELLAIAKEFIAKLEALDLPGEAELERGAVPPRC